MSKTEDKDISPGMVLLLAAATGLIVANLYYAQTLVGPISQSTGLSPQAAGLIVTLTQIGYCLGLLFIVPLGDLLENRRLIVTGLLFTSAMLVLAAFSTTAWMFLTAALGIGLGSVAAQIVVPFAAHLSKEATRGHTVGKVVSGLLLGIMLARPVASLVADASNWHVVFGGGALIVLLVALVLIFLGCISLFFGYHTRHGAVMLFGLTIVAAVALHPFWMMGEGRRAEFETFARDIAICGGLLVMVGMGPGPFAIDNRGGGGKGGRKR